MKLHIISDLHLSVHSLAPPRTDADVVVLAGDIARPPEAIAWALGFEKPVVLVPGNHEFYGSSLQETVQELRRLAQGAGVHVLDNDRLVLDGIRFLGSTLWTDFLAAGSGATQREAMLQSRQFNRDFSRIRAEPGTDGRLFTPQDCAALFACNAQWLRAQLALPFAGPTVVVTHHAPSLRSVPARFAGSPLNPNFVSDAEQLLAGGNARLWVHGHLHDSFDYAVHGTRVLCNPRGYARDGINENPHFDPQLTVDIGYALGP
jgi:3',5'-cyclic AMP phosphodiesterase CpdA